jgi:hypothetical protein
MPYKFNEGRRHKFLKARYRVTNWPDYDAALVRRGELTVWLTEEAIASWYAIARQVGCPMSDSKDGRSLRVWNMA